MSILFGRGRKHIPKNALFRITQEGRDKLQEFGGDARSQILMALETRGTSNIIELSQSTGLNPGKIERVLPSLAPVYIQYVSSASDDME